MINRASSETLNTDPAVLPHLSNRENQVALLFIDFHSRKEISLRLGIGYYNVCSLLFRIRAKIDASCDAEMVVKLLPFRNEMEHPIKIP